MSRGEPFLRGEEKRMLGDCGRSAALGLDIGGTAIKAGWVRPSGEVTAFFTFPTPIDRPQDDAIRLIARALLDFCDGDTPLAVGVGCAGLVSSRSGIVHVSPNLPLWREAPLGPLLAQELGSPVFVLNDANAFALAEARVGAGGGFSPVVALTLGTGVGGAIVVDGRLAEGLHGFGGEVGHMSVSWEGPPCPCGSRGCVEVFVGRRALVDAYFSRSEWRSGVVGHDLAAGNRDAVDPKLLAAAAAAGDR
ncbi:MAG: ROK family protein, partial [Candidatus Eisenbacteria bacterium]